jgi:LysM repeat protein
MRGETTMFANRLLRRRQWIVLGLVAILIGSLFIFIRPVSARQGTHVVQPGEELRFIAPRYGATWQAMALVNNLPNPNLIYTGQVLVIPSVGGPVVNPTRQYVIQPGDYLGKIAAQFGTTWQAIAQINNLQNPRVIHVGNVLTIPGTGGPVVQPPPPPTTGGAYVVQFGDTMYKIGARFAVNIWDIARANGILNLNRIFAGQVLAIPGR